MLRAPARDGPLLRSFFPPDECQIEETPSSLVSEHSLASRATNDKQCKVRRFRQHPAFEGISVSVLLRRTGRPRPVFFDKPRNLRHKPFRNDDQCLVLQTRSCFIFLDGFLFGLGLIVSQDSPDLGFVPAGWILGSFHFISFSSFSSSDKPLLPSSRDRTQ